MRQPVERPERAALRRRDQAAVLDHEVGDRHERQAVGELLPAAAVVEAAPHGALGAAVQQPRHDRVGPDAAREPASVEAAGDLAPRRAEVVGGEEVRPEVVELVARRREVAAAVHVRVAGDAVDLRPFRQALRRHVGPVRPAVAGHVHAAVVAAGPDGAALPALVDGEDRAVVLDAGVVLGDRPARRAHLALVVARQVGADRLPTLALVAAGEQRLGRGVEQARLVPAPEDREVPLEAVLQRLGACPHRVVRPHVDAATQAAAVVLAHEVAAVAAAEHHVRLAGLRRQPPALAAGGVLPVALADAGAAAAVADAHRAVVLLAAVDPVRRVVVDGDAVELRRRLVVDRRPGRAAVRRHARAAVVALDHALRILRIDPQVMVVAVRHADGRERLAAVRRLVERDVQHVDGVHRLRIGVDARVVPRALTQVAVLVDALPRAAGVVAAEQAAVLGLDLRVEALLVRRRGADAGDAEHALGHAGLVVQRLPTVAAVGRLPQAAALATGLQRPRQPDGAPRRRVQRARVVGREAQIDGAGVFVGEQHALPRRAPVGRAVDAALGVRAGDVAHDRRVDGVRVGRVDAQAADVPRVRQAGERPRRAGVGRLPHAVAAADVAAPRLLAAADVHDARVARRDGDGADRTAERAVADVAPRRAAIGRLPDAAAARPHVVRAALAGDAGHGGDAAAAERPDEAPLQRRQQVVRHRAARFLRGQARQRGQDRERRERRASGDARAGRRGAQATRHGRGC